MASNPSGASHGSTPATDIYPAHGTAVRAAMGRARSAMAVGRDPVLRKFWLSQIASEIGDWVGFLGVAYLLYVKTGLPAYAAATTAALYLPYLLAPWLTGFTALIPPKQLLVACDVIRAALLPLLLLNFSPQVLLILLFVASLPTPVYEATRSAVVPDYAPDDDTLDDALALFQSTQATANMLGLVAGGASIVLLGPKGAVLVNALSFLVSALLLLRLPAVAPVTRQFDKARHLVREGFDALRHRRSLRRAVLLAVVSASTIMAGESLVVVYADRTSHPGLAGPLAALTPAVAALLGIVLPRQRSSMGLLRLSAVVVAFGATASLWLFLLPMTPWWGALGFVALGVVSAPGTLMYIVAVREMPGTVRTPVFAIVQVMLMGGQATVALVAGRLADAVDVARVIALLQIPTLVIGIAFALVVWRSADRDDDEPYEMPETPETSAAAGEPGDAGGTESGQPASGDGGLSPAHDGRDLVEDVPGLADLVGAKYPGSGRGAPGGSGESA
jgi:hypothetical protein